MYVLFVFGFSIVSAFGWRGGPLKARGVAVPRHGTLAT